MRFDRGLCLVLAVGALAACPTDSPKRDGVFLNQEFEHATPLGHPLAWYVEADAGTVATLATDVVAPENVESASAMSVMVAGNTVGATITVSPTSLVRGGLRGMRRRAGRLNVGAQGVAAFNAMPGGWWFRHSCFIP